MQYKRGIERFLTYTKISSLSGLLLLPPKDIEQLVIHYITYLKARGLSHAYVNLAMATIFHLTDMNDVLCGIEITWDHEPNRKRARILKIKKL